MEPLRIWTHCWRAGSQTRPYWVKVYWPYVAARAVMDEHWGRLPSPENIKPELVLMPAGEWDVIQVLGRYDSRYQVWIVTGEQ